MFDHHVELLNAFPTIKNTSLQFTTLSKRMIKLLHVADDDVD